MRKKKNRFLLFCFSFLPGAGEMYLGFMKMGVSLLGVFMISAVVTGFMGIGILVFVPMVIWVYGFFHANNLGGLNDDEFYKLEDTYMFGLSEKEIDSIKQSLSVRYRKGAAVVIILIGIVMLWDVVVNYLYELLGADIYNYYIGRYIDAVTTDLPRLIVSIAIIWIGVKLIKGKNTELSNMEEDAEKNVSNPEHDRGNEND